MPFSTIKMTGKWHRLRSWTRRLWWIAGAGVLIAIAPIIIALVGLAFDSMYLQTYHWLAYFSVPVGLPITLFSGIAATFMTIRDLSKNKNGQSG